MRDAVVYANLVALRVALAFLGTAYIHPDEYFQNGEVTADAILGVHTRKTWEWDPAFPCRSISGPLLTTGIPFAVLKMMFNGRIPPLYIFAAERLSFLLQSFILDYCVYCLVPIGSQKSLILLASSSTLLTFQLRPFSNSTEAVLLAVALMIYKRIYERPMETSRLSVFAVIVALGTFLRITFLGLVTPIALGVLRRVAQASTPIKIRLFIRQLAVPALVGLVANTALAVLDSKFFHGDIGHLVLTPYNLLLYNLSSENLAKHGLHPRWLHITVNLPMVVGPALAIYGSIIGREVLFLPSGDKGKTRSSSSRAVMSMCVYVIITSLALLSMQPHQEPRFLIPLLVPFIILIGNSGFVSRAGKWFWIVTLTFNFALVLVFGVLHQGGIVRSLFKVHSLLASQGSINGVAVVYWKTYMPPWHLSSISEQDNGLKNLTLVDLAGASQHELQATLFSLSTPENTTLYLVTPPFAIEGLDSHLQTCFDTTSMIYPHLDLDHIAESAAMGWSKGLSLGVYTAISTCVRAQTPSPP